MNALTVQLPDLAEQIRAADSRVMGFANALVSDMVEAGRLLTVAKMALPHGQFQSWVVENTGFSKMKTSRYMRAYKAKSNASYLLTGDESLETLIRLGRQEVTPADIPPSKREDFLMGLIKLIPQEMLLEAKWRAALPASISDSLGAHEARERISHAIKLGEEVSINNEDIAYETNYGPAWTNARRLGMWECREKWAALTDEEVLLLEEIIHWPGIDLTPTDEQYRWAEGLLNNRVSLPVDLQKQTPLALTFADALKEKAHSVEQA